MIRNESNKVLDEILNKIELPDSAYEKAEARYKDIGSWLQRPESKCAAENPHVFAQGSFRLGTATKPLYVTEEYDLDLACNLSEGVHKGTTTQKELKDLVGGELKLYRKARNIDKSVEEKRRCWRLNYADGLSFHMDVVPCIPESAGARETLKRRMVRLTKLSESLATDVSSLAVSITDNTNKEYHIKTDDWHSSNPEGYARWFEARMRTAEGFIKEYETRVNASIDSMPSFKWKTPLQKAVQLLKRHRDTMFKGNEDSKPISVIITTLAGKSYDGEGDVATTVINILDAMALHINTSVPVVPNPVNPEEDFADKWYDPEYKSLHLKENFEQWLLQAQADFKAILTSNDVKKVVDASDKGLNVILQTQNVKQALGLPSASAQPIQHVESDSPKPWAKR